MQEWCGDTAIDGRFSVRFQQADPCSKEEENLRSLITATGIGPGFEARHEIGTTVELLDEERVQTALQTLHKEQDIADAMVGNPRRSRKERQKNPRSTSIAPPDARERRDPEWVLKGSKECSGPCSGGGHGNSNESLETDPGRVKERERRGVLAVYRHRGAQLVLEQTRKQHPFRQEGVFCRANRGEWAGQVT